MDTHKIKAILQWPLPRIMKASGEFLGLTSGY